MDRDGLNEFHSCDRLAGHSFAGHYANKSEVHIFTLVLRVLRHVKSPAVAFQTDSTSLERAVLAVTRRLIARQSENPHATDATNRDDTQAGHDARTCVPQKTQRRFYQFPDSPRRR